MSVEILQKLIRNGFDNRFGYKVVSGENLICLFCYMAGEGLWKEFKTGNYFTGEGLEIALAAESNFGELMVLSCCCDDCVKKDSRKIARDFTAETGILVSHTFWPHHADAQIARMEKEQNEHIEKLASKMHTKGNVYEPLPSQNDAH